MEPIRKILVASLASACLLPVSQAHAQAADPDYPAAINLINLFQKQCFAKFPDFNAIRAEAKANNWVVGPLNKGKEVSWAVNEGADNFSLMVVDSVANSSKTCEVRGKASEATTVSAFNGIYADKIRARRTGAPENTWQTPNGLVTIQTAPDGRTSAILSK